MASSIMASETSDAPASTIAIASSDAATIKSKGLSCCCGKLGFKINAPSASSPTRTQPIGPLNGMSETISAAEAAVTESTSGENSGWYDSGIAIIWVSFRMP